MSIDLSPAARKRRNVSHSAAALLASSLAGGLLAGAIRLQQQDAVQVQEDGA